MENSSETFEVPVLELEYDKFLELCKKINLVDCVTTFSMPNHSKIYANREKTPIGDLVMELVEYHKDENSWRVQSNKIVDFSIENNEIKFLDKTIFNSPRIIVISKMNSVFLIPCEKSIESGNCKPNEIYKLSNLISSQLFLLQFKDIKNEETDKFDLRAEYSLINRTSTN